MRLLSLDPDPFHRLRYLNARRRGGVESTLLPFHRGTVDALPDGVEALVLTSDLQGVVPADWLGGELVLLGVALQHALCELAYEGALPHPARVGALLAGDLYSAPGGNVRGATGDVREVWASFAETFRWVAGVAGNHDLFGSEREARRLREHPGISLLDGEQDRRDGWAVAGVGYICGASHKVGRRTEWDQLALIEVASEGPPDLLILHEGPDGSREQRGNPSIRSLLEARPATFVVCGHTHWDEPSAKLANGSHVVNVDARVVVLTTT